MGNLQKRICSLSFSGCSICKIECRIAVFLILICLREVGVLEMLSVASRKLVKLLLAYVEEIVMDVLEGKRCHKMTEIPTLSQMLAFCRMQCYNTTTPSEYS